MKLTSSLFRNNGNYPGAFTCDGRETNPPLEIKDVPRDAKTLALVLRDPDAPSGIFVHWVVWNIDPKIEQIDEDSVPAGALQGRTTDGKHHYVGPCPPSGTHRYIFTVYALDTDLHLNEGATLEQLMVAMHGHIIEQAEIMARYR